MTSSGRFYLRLGFCETKVSLSPISWYHLGTNVDSNFIRPGIRTGRYTAYEDTVASPAYQAIEGGIYNEDLAVAIVDEVENGKYIYKHWSCTGPIGLKEW